jgi:hypothetical protein
VPLGEPDPLTAGIMQFHEESWSSRDDHAWSSTETCQNGHIVTEAVEYIDGVVAGRCSACECRVILPTVPGGLSFLRVQTLLEKLLALRDSGLPATAKIANSSGMMEELSELVVTLAHERLKLGEGAKLLDYARQILSQLESAADA